MVKRYKYLQLLPHSDSSIAVPISGLFTELSDRKIALSRIKTITPESKLPIKEKHKDANRRIGACLGYLSTISYRLTKSEENLFMSLHLDWECLIIFSQIMLDSFSVLIPIFYGISDKYDKRIDYGKTVSDTVDSFNSLDEWFNFHKINDSLTRRYRLIRKKSAWYKKLNTDRTGYIHSSKIPHVIYKEAMKEAGFKIRKNRIFDLRDVRAKRVKEETVEREVKIILQSVLDFLVFCDLFFTEKLKEQKISIPAGTQYKSSLSGDFRAFNKLVFKS